tara:strand:+ start:517 stop:1263 length:747 start_codon:yes stop_codon:yes gene_type:complete
MEESIEYRGFTIEVIQDDCPQNPFEDWDCNLPLMASYGRSEGKDYSEGEIYNYLCNVPTDNQIILHQKKIAELFEDIDLDYFKENEFTKQDKIDKIRYYIEKGNASFDELKSYCDLFKIPALSTSRNGYSQGDYSKLFICYTKEFEERTGCTVDKVDEAHLRSTADLYGYWAFGDVYGYNVEEIGDSCYGFYGTDHEESGLLEYAKNAIDCHLERVKKERFAKIKQLIKAKVSLVLRPKLIHEFQLQF